MHRKLSMPASLLPENRDQEDRGVGFIQCIRVTKVGMCEIYLAVAPPWRHFEVSVLESNAHFVAEELHERKQLLQRPDPHLRDRREARIVEGRRVGDVEAVPEVQLDYVVLGGVPWNPREDNVGISDVGAGAHAGAVALRAVVPQCDVVALRRELLGQEFVAPLAVRRRVPARPLVFQEPLDEQAKL